MRLECVCAVVAALLFAFSSYFFLKGDEVKLAIGVGVFGIVAIACMLWAIRKGYADNDSIPGSATKVKGGGHA